MTPPSTSRPPGDAARKLGSGAMFDGIAGRYDLLNRVMSLGLDGRWRRALVGALCKDLPAAARILDVATGTADVALALAAESPSLQVIGVDPSEQMLAHGREKIATAGLDDRIELQLGDGLSLPFEDKSFDAACVSFGIRNFSDRQRGLAELTRVTRSGGLVAILELAEPRDSGLLGRAARLHVRHVVPRLGAMLSGSREYRYLQDSIAAFPPADKFAAIMGEVGLQEIEIRPITFGAVILFVGRVP
ncbi:MAG TPA: ubiquinone/menaquinone biosynthesis methyltransferase [Nannocystis exedens]|nr:ubiquinone/menaquinone biosynthesis methyltransferase [Nannocystis exedens]